MKYSAKVAEAILDRIAAGESLRAICRDAGMPHFVTVLRWADKNTNGFRGRYALAMDFRTQIVFDEVLEIADTYEIGKRIKDGPKGRETITGDVVERSKLRVEARKWVLARMAPKRYGEKITQELTGPGGGPVRTEGYFRISPEDELFLRRVADTKARLSMETENSAP